MNIKNLLLTGIVALTGTLSAHADFVLQNITTDKYLSMENGVSFCTANRTSVGAWEKFEYVNAGISSRFGGTLYFIKSTHNGKYLRRSGNYDQITCTSVTPDTSDERMLWKRNINPVLPEYTVTLRSESNGKYLRELGAGTSDYVKVNGSTNWSTDLLYSDMVWKTGYVVSYPEFD